MAQYKISNINNWCSGRRTVFPTPTSSTQTTSMSLRASTSLGSQALVRAQEIVLVCYYVTFKTRLKFWKFLLTRYEVRPANTQDSHYPHCAEIQACAMWSDQCRGRTLLLHGYKWLCRWDQVQSGEFMILHNNQYTEGWIFAWENKRFVFA